MAVTARPPRCQRFNPLANAEALVSPTEKGRGPKNGGAGSIHRDVCPSTRRRQLGDRPGFQSACERGSSSKRRDVREYSSDSIAKRFQSACERGSSSKRRERRAKREVSIRLRTREALCEWRCWSAGGSHGFQSACERGSSSKREIKDVIVGVIR